MQGRHDGGCVFHALQLEADSNGVRQMHMHPPAALPEAVCAEEPLQHLIYFVGILLCGARAHFSCFSLQDAFNRRERWERDRIR
jgi:hypothetical protein